MNVKRILCPIDYSKDSQAANVYASLFADATGAEIIYLNVDRFLVDEGSVEERSHELQLRLRNSVRPLVRDIHHSFVVREGEPAREILNLATEKEVDLIVIGTQGRTGAKRLLNGSVCEKVLRHATCPVMAIKAAKNTPENSPEQPKEIEADQDGQAQ